MAKKRETESFDFSTIGEEPQLILETPGRKPPKKEVKEKPAKKSEDEDHVSNIPVPTLVKFELPRRVLIEEDEIDYLSIDEIQEIFLSTMSGVMPRGKFPVVEDYMRVAWRDLKMVGDFEERIAGQHSDPVRTLNVLETIIKFLRSIGRLIYMAELIGDKQCPINFTEARKALQTALDQRKLRKSNLKKKYFEQEKS